MHCSSTDYLNFTIELKAFIEKGDKNEEPFDGFYEMKDFFFKRNTLSRNRPLIYKILDSLKEYQCRKCIFVPPPFPLVKSCNTLETYLNFMKDHKNDLDMVDYKKPKTIFRLFKTIGLSGILILCGLRHTVGSMI